MAKTPPNSPGRTRAVKLIRATALKMVPPSGTVDDLVGAVAQTRGRPIHLLETDSHCGAITGMWIPTEKADYIAYPVDASAAQRSAIVCHELAHMLLGHQPEAKAECRQRLAALMAPHVDPAVAVRFLGRHGYDDRIEFEAEHLATALVTRLAHNADTSAVRRDPVSERLR